MAYKTKIPKTQDDPYEPEGPDGPAAPNPNDPYAPPPTAPATPAPPSGTNPPPDEGVSYLGGSKYFNEKTGQYETQQQWDDAYVKKASPFWDTGGYAVPGYVSQTYNPQAVSGYDPAKWGDPNHQTPKYVVGRILSGYNLN